MAHDSLIYEPANGRLIYGPGGQLIYGDNCGCCDLGCEGGVWFCKHLNCNCYDVESYRCCIKGDIDHPEITNYSPGWLLTEVGDGEWEYSGSGADGTTPIVINLKIMDIGSYSSNYKYYSWVDFRLLVSSDGAEPFLNRTARTTIRSHDCVNCSAGPFYTVPLIWYPMPPEGGFWMPDYSKCDNSNGVQCIARCKPTNNNDDWIATVTLSGIELWDNGSNFPLTEPLSGSHYSPVILDWNSGGINGTHVLTNNGCCTFRKEFFISYEVRDYYDWWNDPESDHSDYCPGRYTTDRTLTNTAYVSIEYNIGSTSSELTVYVVGLKGFGMKHNWDGYPGCAGAWRSGAFRIFRGTDDTTSPSCENDLNTTILNNYTLWQDLRNMYDSNLWVAGKNGSASIQLSGL